MNVKNEAEELTEAARVCSKAFGPLRPRLALILGSGLGNFASEISHPIVVEASSIPHYPPSTVEGHAGRLLVGSVESNGMHSPPVLLFQGRVHYYETGFLHPTTFPVKLASRLGVTHLIATNAAGGINRSFSPGDFMLISDFLSLTFLPVSNQAESNASSPGRPAKPGYPFDPPLNDLLRKSASTLGITLREGVYCWLKGPSYETAAEIEMLSRCGVDAVGMSTVPEVALARELGIRVAGISLISNMATGRSEARLSHHDVTAIARHVQDDFTSLMKQALMLAGPLLEGETEHTTERR